MTDNDKKLKELELLQLEEEEYQNSLNKNQVSAPEKASPIPEKFSNLESAALGTAQGLSLGFADEIEGGIQALPAIFSNERFMDAYRKQRDEARSRYNKAQKDNNLAYLAGEIGGGLPLAAVPALNVAKGLKGLDAIKKAGSLGAATGAIAGFGSSSSDVLEKPFTTIKDVGIGAGLGGIVGGGLQGLIQIPGMGDLSRFYKAGKVADLEGRSILGKAGKQRVAEEIKDTAKLIQETGTKASKYFGEKVTKAAENINETDITSFLDEQIKAIDDLIKNEKFDIEAPQYEKLKNLYNELNDMRFGRVDRIPEEIIENIPSKPGSRAALDKQALEFNRRAERLGLPIRKTVETNKDPSGNIFDELITQGREVSDEVVKNPKNKFVELDDNDLVLSKLEKKLDELNLTEKENNTGLTWELQTVPSSDKSYGRLVRSDELESPIPYKEVFDVKSKLSTPEIPEQDVTFTRMIKRRTGDVNLKPSGEEFRSQLLKRLKPLLKQTQQFEGSGLAQNLATEQLKQLDEFIKVNAPDLYKANQDYTELSELGRILGAVAKGDESMLKGNYGGGTEEYLENLTKARSMLERMGKDTQTGRRSMELFEEYFIPASNELQTKLTNKASVLNQPKQLNLFERMKNAGQVDLPIDPNKLEANELMEVAGNLEDFGQRARRVSEDFDNQQIIKDKLNNALSLRSISLLGDVGAYAAGRTGLTRPIIEGIPKYGAAYPSTMVGVMNTEKKPALQSRALSDMDGNQLGQLVPVLTQKAPQLAQKLADAIKSGDNYQIRTVINEVNQRPDLRSLVSGVQ